MQTQANQDQTMSAPVPPAPAPGNAVGPDGFDITPETIALQEDMAKQKAAEESATAESIADTINQLKPEPLSQIELNEKLITAVETGTVDDVRAALDAGANVDGANGWFASKAAALSGDVEKLDVLSSAGATLTAPPQYGAAEDVASIAANNGHLGALKFALSKGVLTNNINLDNVTDVDCRQHVIASSVSKQSAVDMDDHADAIDKLDMDEEGRPMRQMNAFELMFAKLGNVLMKPVTQARVSTWQKDRHEYLLKDAMESAQKYADNLNKFKSTGPMGHIMSDLNALGKSRDDVEYALRNTEIGKQLDIQKRLSAIDPEEFLSLDRQGKDVQSKMNAALKANFAAKKDVSGLVEDTMSNLAKANETVPRDIKPDGEVEFMGDKIKKQAEQIAEMVKSLVAAMSRLFGGKKAP